MTSPIYIRVEFYSLLLPLAVEAAFPGRLPPAPFRKDEQRIASTVSKAPATPRRLSGRWARPSRDAGEERRRLARFFWYHYSHGGTFPLANDRDVAADVAGRYPGFWAWLHGPGLAEALGKADRIIASVADRLGGDVVSTDEGIEWFVYSADPIATKRAFPALLFEVMNQHVPVRNLRIRSEAKFDDEPTYAPPRDPLAY